MTIISGYAESQEEFDDVARAALDELKEYHRLFTTFDRYEGLENLCTVNELVGGAHRTVTVARPIIDLLLYAKELYVLTEGQVNIAMGSVLSIWHDYRTRGIDDPANAELPPMDKLTAAAAHTDLSCLIIDEEASTVTITDPAMTLDVGAVAKGYAVEMIARSMEAKGITGYCLNVGGNIRTIGEKGNGDAWKVGIENPQDSEDEPYVSYLALAGEAVVTSGSYQRYYLVDGKRYHHIIHPDTLMPPDTYLSVSIIAPSSALGDALSTALFCMSPEEGMALIQSLDGVEAHWVMADGSRTHSAGWSAYTIVP